MNKQQVKTKQSMLKGGKVSIAIIMFILLLPLNMNLYSVNAESISGMSEKEPSVACEKNQLCVIYRRFSINTKVNTEDSSTSSTKGNLLWTAAIRPIGILQQEEASTPNERITIENEKFIVFKISLANAGNQTGKEVSLDVYGGGYDVRDVIEGRKFKIPSTGVAGAKIFIQENDNGVYSTFSDMNKVKPLKSIYFERFNSSKKETAFTNQVIFSTYRGPRTTEPTDVNNSGYVNGEELDKIIIYEDGKPRSETIDVRKVKALGFSHYRLELPFSLDQRSFGKHYTIEIKTKRNNTYFAGSSQMALKMNGCSPKVDLAQDYASGIHFYDLFRTVDFKVAFEPLENEKLGYIGSGKFKVWAPFATKVNLRIDGVVQPLKFSNVSKGVYTLQLPDSIKVTENSTYSYDITNYGVEHQHVIDPYAYVTGKDGKSAYAVTSDSPTIGGKNATNYANIQRQDAVIYEAHIVDVTSQEMRDGQKNTYESFGKSKALKDAKNTGFNFVHILPIQENKRKDDGFVNGNNQNYTWGYGPQNLLAVEGSYATNQEDTSQNAAKRVVEVKDMVKAIHNNGMGVVLDVGFNHIYNTYESNFQKIVPDYYYRQIRATAQEEMYQYKYRPALQPGNLEPLYEGKIAKSNPAANEFASERSMGEKIVIDATVYFAEMYKVDGFRYDLMGVIPYTTMNKLANAVENLNKNAIIYGEGWGGKTRLNNGLTDQQNFSPQINPEDVGKGRWEYTSQSTGRLAVAENIAMMPKTAVFSDKFRNSVIGKVAPTNQDDLGFVETSSYNKFRMDNLRYAMSGGSMVGLLSEYQPPVKSPQQYVNFLDVHDDYTLSDHLSVKQNGRGRYDDKFKRNFDESQKLNRQKMALSMLFLSQGTPILQAGSEFDRTKKNDDVSEFYYAKKLKLEDVTIDYSKLNDPNSKESQLRAFTKTLLALRASDDRFRLTDVNKVRNLMTFSNEGESNAFAVDYKSEKSSKIYKTLYNTSNTDKEFNLDVSLKWKVYKDRNTSVYLSTGTTSQYNTLSNLPNRITLKPGEMLVLEGTPAVVTKATAIKLFPASEIGPTPNGDKLLVKVGFMLEGEGRPTQLDQMKVELINQDTGAVKLITAGEMWYNNQTGNLDIWLDSANFQDKKTYMYRMTYNNKQYNMYAENDTNFSKENVVTRTVYKNNRYQKEYTAYRFLNGYLYITKSNFI